MINIPSDFSNNIVYNQFKLISMQLDILTKMQVIHYMYEIGLIAKDDYAHALKKTLDTKLFDSQTEHDI